MAATEQIVRLREKNHSYTLIMEELGYDLSIIGLTRAHGLVGHTIEQANSKQGLHEGYKRPPKRIGLSEIANLQGEESVSKLKNEVLYLRQEMDFLKKISCLANTEKRGK